MGLGCWGVPPGLVAVKWPISDACVVPRARARLCVCTSLQQPGSVACLQPRRPPSRNIKGPVNQAAGRGRACGRACVRVCVSSRSSSQCEEACRRHSHPPGGAAQRGRSGSGADVTPLRPRPHPLPPPRPPGLYFSTLQKQKVPGGTPRGLFGAP